MSDISFWPCVWLFFQVRSRLLLHPFLRGRPAGRGPLLSQLQSSSGHLQAFVGLNQTWREPCAAGSPFRLPPTPSGGHTLGSSLQGLHLCVFFGGKCHKSNTPPNPRNCCLESCAGHAEMSPRVLGQSFSRICDPKSFHLTVIVALSEYLLVICHEPASFLASVGLS